MARQDWLTLRLRGRIEQLRRDVPCWHTTTSARRCGGSFQRLSPSRVMWASWPTRPGCAGGPVRPGREPTGLLCCWV